MKKQLLLLLLFFGFHTSFARWPFVDPRDEIDQARHMYSELDPRLFSPKTEKKFDEQVEKTKKKCAQLGFDYKEVLERCIALIDEKMRYYETLNKKTKADYWTPVKYFSGAAFWGLYLYFHYTQSLKPSRESIVKELQSLGVIVLSLSSNRISYLRPVWVDKTKIYNLISSLNDADEYSDRSRDSMTKKFAIFAIPVLCILGIANIIDQKYSHFFYKKYCLVKKRLEWHLDNFKQHSIGSVTAFDETVKGDSPQEASSSLDHSQF